MRQGEDDVEVTGLKQILLPCVDPPKTRLRLTLVAMTIATAVVGDGWLSATLQTNIDMTAERGSAAPRHRANDLELLDTQVVFVDEVVGLSPKDIRHLEGGPAHWPFFLRRVGFAPRPEIGRASTGFTTV